MTTPLTVWICDVCGDDITEPRMALVTWLTDNDLGGYHRFRIVHKNLEGRRCDRNDPDGKDQHLEFENFLGHGGLTFALSFLSPGPIDGGTAVRVADFNGFVDLVRRTQTPWYEEARRNWGTEETQELFAGGGNPYEPEVLRRIASQDGRE